MSLPACLPVTILPPSTCIYGTIPVQTRYDLPLLLLLLSCFSRVRLCNPIDGSPPGSPVPGILQARTLEWVAISFSNAWKWKVKVKLLSRVRLLATPWTAAYHAPLPMGFSRQEYWSGVPLPSPDLPLTFPNLSLELHRCDCFSFKEHLEGKEDGDSGSLVQGNCHELFNWSLFHEAVLGHATC